MSAEILRGGDPETDTVIVHNNAEYNAVNVAVEVFLRDGRRIKDQRERLQPLMTAMGYATGDYWTIDLGQPENPNQSSRDRVRRIEVTYSDSRLIARRLFAEEYIEGPPFILRTDEEISGP